MFSYRYHGFDQYAFLFRTGLCSGQEVQSPSGTWYPITVGMDLMVGLALPFVTQPTHDRQRGCPSRLCLHLLQKPHDVVLIFAKPHLGYILKPTIMGIFLAHISGSYFRWF